MVPYNELYSRLDNGDRNIYICFGGVLYNVISYEPKFINARRVYNVTDFNCSSYLSMFAIQDIMKYKVPLYASGDTFFIHNGYIIMNESSAMHDLIDSYSYEAICPVWMTIPSKEVQSYNE